MIRPVLAAVLLATLSSSGGVLVDDFEQPLSTHWIVSRPERAHVAPSKDPQHGGVLEADVLFPSSEDNYPGLIYNFQRTSARTDFGVVYIKGNESYAQANPHYDFNVAK